MQVVSSLVKTLNVTQSVRQTNISAVQLIVDFYNKSCFLELKFEKISQIRQNTNEMFSKYVLRLTGKTCAGQG